MLRSTGDIATWFGKTPSQVGHIIVSRRIEPDAIAGGIRLYGDETTELIRHELANVKRGRPKGKPAMTREAAATK